MTSLAPHVSAFFNERLTLERRVSLNTSDSYAYAFKLLLEFAGNRLRVAPSKMTFEQIDAPLVVGFLRHLETSRANGASSRTFVWPQSSRSCTSWNTGFRRLLTYFPQVGKPIWREFRAYAGERNVCSGTPSSASS